MNMDSRNPLGIVTTPEATSAEKRKQMTMMASVGLLAVKPTGLLGMMAFIRRLSKGVFGKIAMGVICSAIYQAIMNFPAFWHGIKVLCAFVGLMGDAKVTRTVRDMLGKGGNIITQEVDPTANDAEEEKPKPTVSQRIKTGLGKAKAATKQVAHDTAVAVEDKVKPIEKDARQAVDEIKGRLGPPQHQMPNAAWTPPPRPPYVAPDTGGIGMGGMPPQPILPSQPSGFGQSVKDFGGRIAQSANAYGAEQALYLEWWREVSRYNAQCPRHHPMKINPRSKLNYGCKVCGPGSSYPAGLLLYNGPPGPPFSKPPAFYAWKTEREKKQSDKKEKP